MQRERAARCSQDFFTLLSNHKKGGFPQTEIEPPALYPRMLTGAFTPGMNPANSTLALFPIYPKQILLFPRHIP